MTPTHHLVPTPAAPTWAVFNHYRAGQSHKPWKELMTSLWHGTRRTPAEKSLNNRAGQVHSKREDRETRREGNDSLQKDRLPGIILQEQKKWVRRMDYFWRKKCDRLKDRNLYQGLSHAHTRNREEVRKHHVVLSGAVSFGLNAVSCQGTL